MPDITRISVFILTAAVVTLHALVAAAQGTSAVPQLTVRRLAEGERPIIDGRVEDLTWSGTEPFSAFIQQSRTKAISRPNEPRSDFFWMATVSISGSSALRLTWPAFL